MTLIMNVLTYVLVVVLFWFFVAAVVPVYNSLSSGGTSGEARLHTEQR